jgi:hypothetical protein
MTQFEVGSKVTHVSLGVTGKITGVSADKITVKFPRRIIVFKCDDPLLEPVQKQSVIRNYRTFTANPILWDEIVSILKTDPNFKTSVSVSPEDEYLVEDEMGAVENLTVASENKLAISYDVRYSTDEKLVNLLQQVGIESHPFFGSKFISLAHGPRKEFYTALRNEESLCNTVPSVQELKQPA